MKKTQRVLTIISMIIILLPLFGTVVSAEESIEMSSEKVEFKEDYNFKTMEASDKEKIYGDLDQIRTSPELTKEERNFSNVKVIGSQDEFEEIIEASNKEVQIIYVGYNACPYCCAFLPKFNQMAKSYDVNIHYYDVDLRSKDENYQDTVSNFFKINTVPHAFIIENGKISEPILDSNSLMQDVEAFVKIVAEK